MITSKYMLTLWRAMHNWPQFDRTAQYIHWMMLSYQSSYQNTIHVDSLKSNFQLNISRYISSIYKMMLWSHHGYDHINDMITSMIWSHQQYDHIINMITSMIWSHWRYDHIYNMITYTVWSHQLYDHINVIITSTVIWLIHNVDQWLLEIQPILDNGDNRSPQVNADFLRLFSLVCL